MKNYDIEEIVQEIDSGGNITFVTDLVLTEELPSKDRMTAGYLPYSNIRIFLYFNCEKFQFKKFKNSLLGYLTPRIYDSSTNKFISLCNKKITVWGKVRRFDEKSIQINVEKFII